MVYLWDDFVYWLEDNWGRALALVAVIFVVTLGIKMIVDEQNEGVPQGSEEILQKLIEDSSVIKESLSEIETRVTNYPDAKYPYYELDLYVKRPFITKQELERTLKQYVEVQKLLLEQEGKKPKAMRFNLYDRKQLWDEGLAPKGVYEYRRSYLNVKEDEMNSTSQGTLTETVQEAAWRITIASKGKPDYSKYELEGNYQYLTYVNGVEPLSDQEFAWYLKYDRYRLFGDPVRVYMSWELGGNQRDSGNSGISRQFKAFQKRLQTVNDILDYHTYEDGEKMDLIITHPQFLYFQETGNVAEDDIDARSKLLALDPQLYTGTIEAWLQQQAEEQVDKAKQTSNNPAVEEQSLPLEGSLADELGGADDLAPIDDSNNQTDESEGLTQIELGDGSSGNN